jgi:hypothetical protein
MTRISIAFRLVIGVGLVLFAGAFGYLHRSPLSLPFLILGFTAAYIGGKSRAWRAALAQEAGRTLFRQVVAAALAQVVLVGLLYLAGFGLGALTRGGVSLHAWSPFDAVLPLAVGMGATGVAFVLQRFEREQSVADLMREFGPVDRVGSGPAGAANPSAADAEVRLLGAPVTVETFYSGVHFSHGGDPPGGGLASAPDARSAGGDPKVDSAEARLGVVLPAGLRALYRIQNGGGVTGLCVPKVPETEVRLFEDILTPFGGYEALNPTESLRSIFVAVSDYANADDPDDAHQYPPECHRMIVLAQWYRETLFLDYRLPGPPRVGHFDLDRGWDEALVHWWPNFETFFGSLRRFEGV